MKIRPQIKILAHILKIMLFRDRAALLLADELRAALTLCVVEMLSSAREGRGGLPSAAVGRADRRRADPRRREIHLGPFLYSPDPVSKSCRPSGLPWP